MNDNSKYCYDTSNSQAACIAHEYLCRESIVPEKTYQSSDESTYEDNQLFASRNVHDVQVAGILYVTGHVSQYSQRNSDDTQFRWVLFPELKSICCGVSGCFVLCVG